MTTLGAALLFGSVRAQRSENAAEDAAPAFETPIEIRIGAPAETNSDDCCDGPNEPPLSGILLRTTSTSDRVTVRAVREANRIRVLIKNTSGAKAQARVCLPLERGVWRVERWALPSPPDNGLIAERQAPLLLARGGNREKPVWIPPLSRVQLEFVNGGQEVTSALRSLGRTFSSIRFVAPDATRRIRAPLASATSHLATVASGYRPTRRDVYLRDAHRAMLYVGHLRAIASNTVRSHGGEALRKLQQSAERLDIALAEHCASLCKVQTQTVVNRDPSDPIGALRVRIVLENGGSEPLANLRLGLGGPAAAQASPNKCATFASLSAGHRAEAEFRLPAGSEPEAVVSAITYVAMRSPVRLRTAALPAVPEDATANPRTAQR